MATATMMKKLSLATAGAAFVALGTVGIAQAASFTESGDAGQTFATAKAVRGGIDVIQGSISSSSDADLFSFSWDGGLFTASTVGGAYFDTMLQLFSSTGILTQNDDSYSTLQSTISYNLNPGNYFLGISSWPNWPTFSATGPIYYSSGYSSGSYSIRLNKETASVPEPASTLSLLMLGAMGAGSMLKRKQRKESDS